MDRLTTDRSLRDEIIEQTIVEACGGQPQIFKDFIEGDYKSKKSIVENLDYIDTTNQDGTTLLHYACLNESNYKIVELFIKRGANLNKKNRFFDTPLSYALKEGNYEIANLLIKHNATINLNGWNNFSILYNNLFEKKNYKMFKFLIEKGVDLDYQARSCLLDHSAKRQNYEAAKFLIEEGAKLDIENKETCSFLINNALANKDYKVLEYLIRNNGLDKDVKIEDIFKYTIINEDYRSIQLLLWKYPNINPNINISTNNNYYETPLQYAVRKENVEIAKFLIQHQNFDISKEHGVNLSLLIDFAIKNKSSAMFHTLIISEINDYTKKSKNLEERNEKIDKIKNELDYIKEKYNLENDSLKKDIINDENFKVFLKQSIDGFEQFLNKEKELEYKK